MSDHWRELDVMEGMVVELVLWKEAHEEKMGWEGGSWDCLLCEQRWEESCDTKEILAKTISKFPN